MASQSIAEILFMQQLGEIGQRVQMLLELPLRHEECICWLRVEGLKGGSQTAPGAHGVTRPTRVLPSSASN